MVHIRRIREKIELNPKEPEYLRWCGGLDTKSKSTAGKQVIGFLCFVMSFSIFFSVGLLLLEQPVYGSNSINFVLSEAF